MTDIFLGLWGRKKKMPDVATSDDSFVSYIEKDLTDDFNDFVLIDTNRQLNPYQTRFDHQNQRNSTTQQYNTTMGNGSSTNGKQQEIIAEMPIPESEEQNYVNFAQNSNENKEETYNVSSFLSGVPFELCSKLNTLQSLQTIKLDGFNYLSSKADLLTNLSYDFRLEQTVLFETECAVSDFKLVCLAE